MERKRIEFRSDNEAITICGKNDEHLSLMEREFGVRIIPKGNIITVEGKKDRVRKAILLIEDLLVVARRGEELQIKEIEYAVSMIKGQKDVEISEIFVDTIEVFSRKKFIRAKTDGQKRYVDAIKKHDIVIGIGPAGTGKTYLAMAMGVSALKRKEISRIILTRPAVEAGESLGFLPGNLLEKISPYLRPLYDALYDMIDYERIQEYLKSGMIEVIPLAYMRGRTLNDSFIILDEAQNSTLEQMKMFLTRLGFDSKVVITGDITQVDLPSQKKSGLIQVQSILKGIKGIEFIYFNETDVVRHQLVQDIVKAYEKHGNSS